MKMAIEQYEHHGAMVFVDSDLRGKHREHCLCFKCGRFNPGIPEANCPTANLLYAVCIKCDITTPVYECPDFQAPEVPGK
jgi:hypothetical protein